VTAKREKEKVGSGHEKIDDLLKFAIEVIHHCGEKALSFYGKGQKDVKFDEGLVTEAELQLREFFQDQLFARFPDHKVYKTDRGDDGYTHGAKRYLWIYDPLDGSPTSRQGSRSGGRRSLFLRTTGPCSASFICRSQGIFSTPRPGARRCGAEADPRFLSGGDQR